MSAKIYRPNGNRRPNPAVIRAYIKQLMDMEPAEHFSDNPKFRSLTFVGMSVDARAQLVQLLNECADWIESPMDVPLMVKMGQAGFRTR